MPNAKKSYASYLLRFRCVTGDAAPAWKPSLQSTATGQQRWFPSVDELVEFLRAEFGGGKELKDAGQRTSQEPEQ